MDILPILQMGELSPELSEAVLLVSGRAGMKACLFPSEEPFSSVLDSLQEGICIIDC